jgi:hypothetical protein
MRMFSTAVAILLEANGLTEADMANGGAAQITHLEMFLHEYPKVGRPRCRRDVAVLQVNPVASIIPCCNATRRCWAYMPFQTSRRCA